jgi:hypothetical protein
VQRLAQRMTVYDGRQSGSFTKLVAKPHTKFCILDLLDSKSDARGENLPDALLGCSLRAVMRNTLAELSKHEFQRSPGLCVHRAARALARHKGKQVLTSGLMDTIRESTAVVV